MKSTYYLSNGGSDSNSGTSINSPFATLNKLNNVLRRGDTVLLREGDIFYGKINTPTSGSLTNPTIIETYGNGEKPIVSGYKKILPTSWVLHSTNVWKVHMLDITKFTGDIHNLSSNVGFLKINGIIHGKKKPLLASITTQWDFFCDNIYLYVFSSGNPSSLSTSFEVCCLNDLIRLTNENYEIYNLKLTGTGSHGVNSTSNNIKIIGLDIDEVGGSYLPGYGDGTVRYGNGIQWITGGKNIEIRNNDIKNVYDVGITLQGVLTQDFEDVIIQGNTTDKCTQSIEFWGEGFTYGFKNVKVKENTFLNAGSGWGYDVRPDANVGVHFLFYNWDVSTTDIEICNNICYKTKDGLYFSGRPEIPAVNSHDNIIIMKNSDNIRSNNNTYKIDNYQQFVSDKSLEIGSKWVKEPSDIKSDYNLTQQLQNIATLAKNDSANIKKTLSVAIAKASSAYERVNEIPLVDYRLSRQVSTSGNFYTKICQIKINEQFRRGDIVLDYMIWGGSNTPRGGHGRLNIQVTPSTDLTSINTEFSVIELSPFKFTYAFTDFVLVKEKSDGTECICSVWFNIGKSTFVYFANKTVFALTESKNDDTFIFYDSPTLVSTLPSGSQVIATKEDSNGANAYTNSAITSATANYYKTDIFKSGLVTTVDSTKWVKLATFKIVETNIRIDTQIYYSLWGDSASPRGGNGVLNIQIVPNSGLTSVSIELSVAEDSKFQFFFTPSDFVIVQEVVDGTQVLCSLWFNIGKKVFISLATKPVMFLTGSNRSDIVTWHNGLTPSSITAGTQTVGINRMYRSGTDTLVNGTVTIPNIMVRTGDIIWVQYHNAISGTTSILTVPTIVNATSFTVNAISVGTTSINTSDNNSIKWWIMS